MAKQAKPKISSTTPTSKLTNKLATKRTTVNPTSLITTDPSRNHETVEQKKSQITSFQVIATRTMEKLEKLDKLNKKYPGAVKATVAASKPTVASKPEAMAKP